MLAGAAAHQRSTNRPCESRQLALAADHTTVDADESRRDTRAATAPVRYVCTNDRAQGEEQIGSGRAPREAGTKP